MTKSIGELTLQFLYYFSIPNFTIFLGADSPRYLPASPTRVEAIGEAGAIVNNFNFRFC
ncbi:hypothetical protein [Phormidium nigroviride]